jgi:hypothetical protein
MRSSPPSLSTVSTPARARIWSAPAVPLSVVVAGVAGDHIDRERDAAERERAEHK